MNTVLRGGTDSETSLLETIRRKTTLSVRPTGYLFHLDKETTVYYTPVDALHLVHFPTVV